MAPAATPRPQLSGDVADALARGVVVVAANARAARALRRAYAAEMRDAGAQSWQSPPIHDWAGWLDEVYIELADGAASTELPTVLNSLQEQHLWRSVQTEEAARVVSPDGLATLAAEAYALLCDYDAHADRRAPWADAHEDARHFLLWADAFDARCESLGAAPAAALAAILRTHVAELTRPRELLLVGFDRLLPAQSALLSALEQHGTLVRQASTGPPAAGRELLCASDEEAEMYACAAWVRGQLEQNPNRRIGVLLPQLGSARARLDRVFRRVLTPEAAMSPPARPAPYEFSLGISLAAVPSVAAALHLLQWLAGPLPSSAVSNLLTGGFVASTATESLRLAEADAALRRKGLLNTEVALGALLEQARTLLPLPFRERAAFALTQAARGRECRTHSEWAGFAEVQLKALGWPGFQEAGSIAFQAMQRWSAFLAEIATLSFAGERMSLRAFVRDLRHAAQGTLFAAESLDAPVQILGVAEASGQTFDAIWLLGATETHWPAPGRMHPLLSPLVQRDRGMPHSSAVLDLQLAEEQLARMLASASIVVASYSRQRDGNPVRPSPLLLAFGEVHSITAANPLAAAPYMVECYREPDRVRPWPGDRVAGGSDVLKRQSACGFQAFAALRLGAEALEDERWGPDARERGGLLHAALEQLWSVEPVPPASLRLHSLDDLKQAAEDGSLEHRVHMAIARAARSSPEETWEQRYLALEQERLAKRLLWWLAEELKRAVPFRVVALEQRVDEAQVGPLRLNLRVDRVDEIDDGRKLVLDYKTGAEVNTKQWLGERPEEPQLPIYARFGGLGDVAAIAFAQIRAGHTKLHLLQEGAEEGSAKRAIVLDDSTRGTWDRALQRLAEEFAAGEAPLNPRDLRKTCDRCGLFGVCRIRSQSDALLLTLHSSEGDGDDA